MQAHLQNSGDVCRGGDGEPLPLHPGHSVQLHVITAPESFGEGIVLNLQLRDLREAEGASWFSLDCHERTSGHVLMRSVMETQSPAAKSSKLRQARQRTQHFIHEEALKTCPTSDYF